MTSKPKSLFDEVFANSWWSEQRNFPPCDDWKDDIEKHLNFMQCKGWLKSIRPQLQSRNYESFLSEIYAAYFVEVNLGFEVTSWNPKTKEARDVEFCVQDKAGSEIFCEVKSPGWQGQLTKEEIYSGRAKRPKHSTFGETRGTTPYMKIRKTLDKSYKKFISNKQNLLIITDNLFKPPSFGPRMNPELGRKIPWDIYIALYNYHDELYSGKGCFRTKEYENLGGILFLNDRFLGKFFAWFETNPNANMPLNEEFVSEALKLNEQRIKLSERDYIKHDGTD